MDPKGDTVSLGSSASSSDGEWQDIEPDQEQISVLSFFDDVTFPNANEMLDYSREKYGFDFLATQRRLGLDFHGAVKLCNFGMILDPSPRPLQEDINMSLSLERDTRR